MATIANCVRHTLVRNACLLRVMLPRTAVVGIQQNDMHTKTCNQFYALHKSSLIQVHNMSVVHYIFILNL
jgi:hypothetical protein